MPANALPALGFPSPSPTGSQKWVYRQSSQEVCPWNVRFASELAEDSPFAPREVIAGKDSRTLAREILAMSQEEFATAFRRSPMKRAKLKGPKRDAAVVLGNTGTMVDVPVLEQAIDHPEPLLREHLEWAMVRIEISSGSGTC